MKRIEAAPAYWPYLDHRTVGEIDALPRPINVVSIKVLGQVASLPDRPCVQCGARGWCGHHGRMAA